jgi:hypothetical protein
MCEGVSKSFWTESIMKYTTINTHWETTQRVMVAKLTKLTHKIEIQLHLVAESCTSCSSCSRQPVRKLLYTPSLSCLCNTMSWWSMDVKAILLDIGTRGRGVPVLCSSWLTTKERDPNTHWIGDWGEPRAYMNTVTKRKLPTPTINEIPQTLLTELS